MLTYIARVKMAAKQLTNAGETVSNTNLFNKTISGLSDRYDAVKVYLGMDSALTEERLTQVLIAEESRKLMAGDKKERGRERERSSETRERSRETRERSRETRERSRETYMERRYKQRKRSRSKNRPTPARQRSPPRSQRSPLRLSGRRNKFCKTCDMFGHDEETCFKLHPDLLARRHIDQSQRRLQYPNNVWTQTRQGTFQPQP